MGTELEQLVDEFSARKLASGDGCVVSVHIQVDKRQLFQGVVHRYEGHELHCFASKYQYKLKMIYDTEITAMARCA